MLKVHDQHTAVPCTGLCRMRRCRYQLTSVYTCSHRQRGCTPCATHSLKHKLSETLHSDVRTNFMRLQSIQMLQMCLQADTVSDIPTRLQQGTCGEPNIQAGAVLPSRKVRVETWTARLYRSLLVPFVSSLARPARPDLCSRSVCVSIVRVPARERW
jgi:hypothetical protein